MKSSAKEAFHWIIKILNKHNVPFQISGGLAAKVYGSSRPLYDIDIEMSDEFFQIILDDVKNHIIFGPKRNISETFNVLRLSLNYKGQDIDLTGTDEKVFDKEKNSWIDNSIDLSKSKTCDIFSLKVPVISKEALITCKEKTLRDVDKIDLKEINK